MIRNVGRGLAIALLIVSGCSGGDDLANSQNEDEMTVVKVACEGGRTFHSASPAPGGDAETYQTMKQDLFRTLQSRAPNARDAGPLARKAWDYFTEAIDDPKAMDQLLDLCRKVGL